MDNPKGATNNDTIEQLSSMSTPIVSTLTTATPITSEIVSDFEPDSKFEITTLEMASYDCQDLYSAANLLEPQDVEPHSSASTIGSDIPDIAEHQAKNPAQPDHISLVEPQRLQEDDKPRVSSEQPTNVDENHKDLESITLVEQQQQTKGDHTSMKLNVKLDQLNDCKHAEKDIKNSDTQSTLVSKAQADQIVTNSNTTIQPTKAEFSGDKPASDHGLVSETNSDLFSADHASKNNADITAHPLSQTSVDAQMEKVIDNIVELGGIHQFPQSLVNPEGKEEFLATIHREITGERGSIDLIADVASRQKSIEIEPVEEPDQPTIGEEKESESIHNSGTQISSKKMENLDTTKNANENPQVALATTDNKSVRPEMDSAQLVEEQINQGEFSGQDVIEELVTDEKIIEEKLGQEEIVEQRVVEEVVMDEGIVENKSSPPSLHIHETNAGEEVSSSNKSSVGPEEAMVDSKVEEERAPTRSPRFRETNDDKKVGEDQTPARSSRRRAAAAKERVKDNRVSIQPTSATPMVVEEAFAGEKVLSQPSTETASDGQFRDETAVHQDLPSKEAAVEEKSPEHRSPLKSSRRRGAVAKEPPRVSAEGVTDTLGDKALEEKVDDATADEAMAKKVEVEVKMDEDQSQIRSLRPRASLKRTHVEDTQVDNPPKAEPPKKQMKKSRSSTIEHAPIIKLPNFRSRTTISSSDPITRLDKKYETKAPKSIVPKETEKKYICEQCGYATDRLNNLVYHSTKSFCQGKCQIGEVMKADIIRQQQQAKNKRRSIR